MTDLTTKKPMRVLVEGTAPPYLLVPVSQLFDLKTLFDKHQIFYTIDEDFISLDGGPEVGTVDLGPDADAAVVQTILNSVH